MTPNGKNDYKQSSKLPLNPVVSVDLRDTGSCAGGWQQELPCNASGSTNSYDRAQYISAIINTIVSTGAAEPFICAVTHLCQRLAVAKLHVIGDIWDRGPGAEIILDTLDRSLTLHLFLCTCSHCPNTFPPVFKIVGQELKERWRHTWKRGV